MAVVPDGLLSSPVRVESILGRTGLDVARVMDLLAGASAAFRSATRQHISRVAGDVVALDGDGSSVLLLPQVPVTAVTSVVVDDGSTSTTLAAADYQWFGNGVLRRSGKWPARPRSVTVTYDHGYDPIPDDVQEAVAKRAARGLDERVGVASAQLGAASYTFTQPGPSPEWDEAVAAYRVVV